MQVGPLFLKTRRFKRGIILKGTSVEILETKCLGSSNFVTVNNFIDVSSASGAGLEDLNVLYLNRDR